MSAVLFSITENYFHYSLLPYLPLSFEPNYIIKIYSYIFFLQNIIITVITRNSQVIKSQWFCCISIFYWNLRHFSLHRIISSQFIIFSIINTQINKNLIIFLAFWNLSSNILSYLSLSSFVSITVLSYSYVSASSEA